MANLKNIKLRMTSVQNTMHITKAMKMVAAAKMRHAEERIKNAKPYSERLHKVLLQVLQNNTNVNNPFLQNNSKSKKAILILYTTDRGLCGGLNNNLCRIVEKFIQEQDKQIELLIFGKKGKEFFQSKKEYTVYKTVTDVKDKDVQAKIRVAIETCLDLYEKEEIDAVYLASNSFKNVITHEQRIDTLLPIQVDEKTKEQESEVFLFEQSLEELLSKLLPEYAVNFAGTAGLSQMACEHAARMTAMDSATNNAMDMLDRLSLYYNRERQSAITTELTEIVSGAESV